jgi:hypothetical protein
VAPGGAAMNRRCIGCGVLFEPKPGYEYHRRCWPCWRKARGAGERTAGGRTYGSRTDSPAPADSIAISVEAARAAVRLCHPDRHPEPRSLEATRITALLNGALDAHRRRRTA